jgi:dTDP-4-dehydrorhamnose reductase
MDISDVGSVRRVVREIHPDVLINAAAYTLVDKAESESLLARRLNGVAPGVLAEEVGRVGGLLVHYSTDYVFDGTKAGAYTEEDEPNPVSVYGATKLEGERAIQKSGAAHIILRTSWIYGARGRNFLLTMMRLLRERRELEVVVDQVGAPTLASWIAESTLAILQARLAMDRGGSGNTSDIGGVFHLTAGGATSWFRFAVAIARYLEASGVRVAEILPIASEEYPAAARRPLNSLLSNARLNARTGLVQADWEQLLARCMMELESG